METGRPVSKRKEINNREGVLLPQWAHSNRDEGGIKIPQRRGWARRITKREPLSTRPSLCPLDPPSERSIFFRALSDLSGLSCHLAFCRLLKRFKNLRDDSLVAHFSVCLPSFPPSFPLPTPCSTPFFISHHNSTDIATMVRRLSAFFGIGSSSDKPKTTTLDKTNRVMEQRWGPPESERYEMVMRYWVSTRMDEYWNYLRNHHPNEFQRRIKKGYMEPVPTRWIQNRYLATSYMEGSYWENPAEKRLYFVLNNGKSPDGKKHPPLRPLNIRRDWNTILLQADLRMTLQIPIDPRRLALYQSPGDVFQYDPRTQSHEYSSQVVNVVYEARRQALHELAEGLHKGTDHLETMLLIDTSGSMGWDPHGGIQGPDGMRRYHDQPSNISLVEHLVHRVLHHMVPRAQQEHPHQVGIDTVTFSSAGNYVGQISANNFQNDWRRCIRVGGGTQVMQGWQVVKNTYFNHQHRNYGHGRFDDTFGWQPTPGMPKLSLLVFLDGEALDMDEFELELLGETWAYVTIALVGMENCPHHHSHAIELERVARFNPHIGFFDVHGRVCERLVVEDLLKSVYPVDPPMYQEILKPEFDLPAGAPPVYSAW